MIIGICGKSGSGKSTLAREISYMHDNVIHIDIDLIGHKVLELDEVKQELINSFGEEVINNGNVDRKVLSDLVFNSRNKMNKLSDITWQHMQTILDELINKNKDRIILLDWILLPKTKYFKICDFRILIDVPFEIRKQRITLRDNISQDKIDLRESASIEYDYNDFDFVINDISDEFKRKLVKII